MARRIPGKEEFDETLRYYRTRLAELAVELRLGALVDAEQLAAEGFDEIVLATGVTPRTPADLPGIDHPSVVGYLDVLRDGAPVGERVAVLGAGGIGFDVAEYLTDQGDAASLNPPVFHRKWGIDPEYRERGGLTRPEPPRPRAAST